MPIGVCKPTTEEVTELPPKGAENIIDILNSESNPTECMVLPFLFLKHNLFANAYITFFVPVYIFSSIVFFFFKQGESDDVNFKKELAHVPLPSGSQCFPLIGRIPSFGNDLFDGRSRLVDWRSVCCPNDDEVESIRKGGISVFNAEAVIREVDKNAARVFGKAILDKVCRTPFDGIPSFKGDFDSLYATILQRGVDVTPLESKVEGLIKQACDLKDLQQSYSGRTSAEEHDTYRMEVQGSRRLNTEGAHYEAKTAELKHVESRRQELLKELQLLEEQQKDLTSQRLASICFKKLSEKSLIHKIDILSATEVIDDATKASLEKIEAYIKESFEDLKNFQWDP
ncbi:LOW QUALITY PROTEIN: hypothetical protein Cgig2_009957 [Carnegiea gigantea]|uniref:Uncharacterized protein n=1 Tax=Carnegiea gigantea TaxID=171969 RepID=A0A9Q1JVZ5_9CARY|nr:LOW QUALITY PROTEIN: hypothetical protein Cgig2_009957 [Carnegiea gigantea]